MTIDFTGLRIKLIPERPSDARQPDGIMIVVHDDWKTDGKFPTDCYLEVGEELVYAGSIDGGSWEEDGKFFISVQVSHDNVQVVEIKDT